MQSYRLPLLVAALNVRAGLALSFILQVMLFRVLWIAAPVSQRLVMTVPFTALSLACSLVFRRLFNRLLQDHCQANSPNPERVLP